MKFLKVGDLVEIDFWCAPPGYNSYHNDMGIVTREDEFGFIWVYWQKKAKYSDIPNENFLRLVIDD